MSLGFDLKAKMHSLGCEWILGQKRAIEPMK